MKSRPKPTARNKMMDMIARRDHSEKELRKKLKTKNFSPEEIDKAIQYGKDHKWIPEDNEGNEKLSDKLAQMLHRRSKGIQYINQYLYEKGLPPIESDPDLELEKALSLVKNKYPEMKMADAKIKAKVGRFLAARGFDLSIVRKVIYEEL